MPPRVKSVDGPIAIVETPTGDMPVAWASSGDPELIAQAQSMQMPHGGINLAANPQLMSTSPDRGQTQPPPAPATPTPAPRPRRPRAAAPVASQPVPAAPQSDAFVDDVISGRYKSPEARTVLDEAPVAERDYTTLVRDPLTQEQIRSPMKVLESQQRLAETRERVRGDQALERALLEEDQKMLREEIQAERAAFEEDMRRRQSEVQKEIESATVEEEWKGKKTGDKVLAVLGVFLQGLAGNRDAAMQLRGILESDVDAKRQALQRKGQVIAEERRTKLEEQQGKELELAKQYEAAIKRIDAFSTQIEDADDVAKLEALKADLRSQQLGMVQNVLSQEAQAQQQAALARARGAASARRARWDDMFNMLKADKLRAETGRIDAEAAKARAPEAGRPAALPPGVVGDQALTPKQAEEVTERSGAFKTFDRTMQELQTIREGVVGLGGLDPELRARGQTLVEMARENYRVANRMGTADAGTKATLERLIPDITSVGQVADQYETVREQAKDAYDDFLGALRLQRQEPSAPRTTAVPGSTGVISPPRRGN